MAEEYLVMELYGLSVDPNPRLRNAISQDGYVSRTLYREEALFCDD